MPLGFRVPDTPLSISSFSSPVVVDSEPRSTQARDAVAVGHDASLPLLGCHPIHSLRHGKLPLQQQNVNTVASSALSGATPPPSVWMSTRVPPPKPAAPTASQAGMPRPAARAWGAERSASDAPATLLASQAERLRKRPRPTDVTGRPPASRGCVVLDSDDDTVPHPHAGADGACAAVSEGATPLPSSLDTRTPRWGASARPESPDSPAHRVPSQAAKRRAVIHSDTEEEEAEEAEHGARTPSPSAGGRRPSARDVPPGSEDGSAKLTRRHMRRLRREEDAESVEAPALDESTISELDPDLEELCTTLTEEAADLSQLSDLCRRAKRAKKALNSRCERAISPDELARELGVGVAGHDHPTAVGRCLASHQYLGVNWLLLLHHAAVNGMLADSMGLGKTVQVAVLLAVLAARRQLAGPCIIVTPASTLENWERELAKWAPALRVSMYRGGAGSLDQQTALIAVPRDEAAASPTPGRCFDVLLTSYTMFDRSGAAAQSHRSFLHRLAPFDYIILDEGHALKNAESARHKNVFKLSQRCSHCIILSGTPFQNDLGELTALLRFVAGSNIMPAAQTSKTIAAIESIVLGRGVAAEGEAPRTKALSLLNRICQPFILRRKKEEVLNDMPPKVESWSHLEMCDAQSAVYGSLISQLRVELGSSEGISASRATNMFANLRKACQHSLLLRNSWYTDEKVVRAIAEALRRLGTYKVHASKAGATERILAELRTMSDYEIHRLCATESTAQADVVDGGPVCTFVPEDAGTPPFTTDSLPAACTPVDVLRAFRLPTRALLEGAAKFARLHAHIPALLGEGHRVLLFSQWTSILDLLEELLGMLSIPFLRLDGNTAVQERQALIDRFSAPAPTERVFLLSTRAGGLGLNLVAADTVIIYDSDLNPHVDAQAVDRAHRMGQRSSVHVYRLCTQGTVDEVIREIATRKGKLEAVIDETRRRELHATPSATASNEADVSPDDAEDARGDADGTTEAVDVQDVLRACLDPAMLCPPSPLL